jgi:hypothetical protein
MKDMRLCGLDVRRSVPNGQPALRVEHFPSQRLSLAGSGFAYGSSTMKKAMFLLVLATASLSIVGQLQA